MVGPMMLHGSCQAIFCGAQVSWPRCPLTAFSLSPSRHHRQWKDTRPNSRSTRRLFGQFLNSSRDTLLQESQHLTGQLHEQNEGAKEGLGDDLRETPTSTCRAEEKSSSASKPAEQSPPPLPLDVIHQDQNFAWVSRLPAVYYVLGKRPQKEMSGTFGWKCEQLLLYVYYGSIQL